jgi:hypothetical protein
LLRKQQLRQSGCIYREGNSMESREKVISPVPHMNGRHSHIMSAKINLKEHLSKLESSGETRKEHLHKLTGGSQN